MAVNYHLLSYDSYKRICNVIHSLDDVLTHINDNFDTTNTVWSSQKISQVLQDLEDSMQEEIDNGLTTKATISIAACPADADMETNKLYFEPLTDAEGNTYYDCYSSLEGIGKLFLGSSTFAKDKYLTKEEMDDRYSAVDFIDKNAEAAPISSKGMYGVMNQTIPAFDSMFLSTHDNLIIPNIEQEDLFIGGAFPIGDGYILQSYRNGCGYWNVKFVRGSFNLAEETPSAVQADTAISEELSNKDEFLMACAAWPELRDAALNEEWVIPLQSKLMYIDDAQITYSAELVIKNASTTDANTVKLYLRASEEIPTGTVLYGSSCFTINHIR